MSTYAMGGGRSMRTCAYEGGGGSNFCHFGAYVLIEILEILVIEKLHFLYKQMEFTFLLSFLVNFAYPRPPHKVLILFSQSSSQYHYQQKLSSRGRHVCFALQNKKCALL